MKDDFTICQPVLHQIKVLGMRQLVLTYIGLNFPTDCFPIAAPMLSVLVLLYSVCAQGGDS